MVNINSVAELFFEAGAIQNISPITDGLINQTYKVATDVETYILQSVNHEVFKDPVGISNNIEFLNATLENSEYPYELLKHHKSNSGNLVEFHEGNYWRTFHFIKGTVTQNTVSSPKMAYMASKAFAEFILFNEKTDTTKIVPGIPSFMDFESRITNFNNALQFGNKDRISSCSVEIDYLKGQIDHWNQFIVNANACPKRLIHADAKISNILFDAKSLKPRCIIDLDTVMAGPIIYDFSDLLRSYCNTLREDDTELGESQLALPVLHQSIVGFVSTIKKIATAEELEALKESIPFITYIQTLRFLTDFLLNDIYYTTTYPLQNLDRTRNQLNLYKLFLKNHSAIEASFSKALSMPI